MERNEDCYAAKNGEVSRNQKEKILSYEAQDFFVNLVLLSFIN